MFNTIVNSSLATFRSLDRNDDACTGFSSWHDGFIGDSEVGNLSGSRLDHPPAYSAPMTGSTTNCVDMAQITSTMKRMLKIEPSQSSREKVSFERPSLEPRPDAPNAKPYSLPGDAMPQDVTLLEEEEALRDFLKNRLPKHKAPESVIRNIKQAIGRSNLQ
jgi:hypothetical protein